MEMMEIDDELRDMDEDVVMEDSSGIRKKTSFARKQHELQRQVVGGDQAGGHTGQHPGRGGSNGGGVSKE